MRSRVGVLGTGGTISIVGADPFDVLEYADHGRVMEVDELVGRIPDLDRVAEVVPIPFRALRSTEMGPPVWLELRTAVLDALVDQAMAGLVVTHGTASLEETAWFLHLTLPVDVPVVVVGAQRPSTALSSDAQMNLVGAVRVAAAREARAKGVLVVLNDEVQGAREVTKGSNHRLEAFHTPELGVLGSVEADGHVAFYRSPTRRHTTVSRFAQPGYLDGVTDLPRVDIVVGYAGTDGWAVDAAVARAVVVAGLAPGLNPPAQDAALTRARDAGVVVVQGSRAGAGRVLRRRALREGGVVVADNLNPQKARILTMLALVGHRDPEELQELFDMH